MTNPNTESRPGHMVRRDATPLSQLSPAERQARQDEAAEAVADAQQHLPPDQRLGASDAAKGGTQSGTE